MKLKKNNKKGFTIVELVIVIAVIAILAAVLIPTFTGLIKKANVSNDTQLVRNLNTALAADVDGCDTMTDALEAAEEFGYNVEKINAKATGNKILWDSANNVFCYYNDEAKGIEYIPETSLKVTEVEAYQYWMIADELPDEQTYSIYASNNFTVTEVTVSVGFDSGENQNIDVTYETDKTQEVTIRTNGGKLTVNAANSTVNYYGFADEIIVTAVAANTFNVFGEALFMDVAADQHVVIQPTAKVNAVWVNDNDTANVEINNGANNIVSNGTNETEKTAVKYGATLFAGGTGTESDPFLIADYDTFQHVSDLCSEGYYYFKVKDGVTSIDCKNWTPVFLYGSIDGNNVVLNNLDKWLFDDIIYGDGSEQVIKDMTVNCRIIVYGYGAAALCKYCLGNVTFENIDVNGYIEGRGNSAVYVAYGSWDKNNTLHLKNCGGDATLLVKQEHPGIYMGHHGTQTSIILEDCSYNGTAYTPDGTARTTADYTGSSWASFKEIENGVELEQVEGGKLYSNTIKIDYTILEIGNRQIGDVFEVTASTNSSYAVAELMIAPNGNGTTVIGNGYTGTYMSEQLEKTNGKYVTENVKYYNVAINANGATKTGVDGDTFNVVSSSYNNTYSSASIMITEYDANNNVIAVWVWSLPVNN